MLYPIVTETRELAREVDPKIRPVTIVTHLGSTPDKDKVAELLDVLTFNRYYGWYVDVELRSRWKGIP
jgi:hypothetical protein